LGRSEYDIAVPVIEAFIKLCRIESSLHRDMETFRDSDSVLSQETSIPRPEEAEAVSPDDGGTDIRDPTNSVDSKRQKSFTTF
jgi:hypothetical protein